MKKKKKRIQIVYNSHIFNRVDWKTLFPLLLGIGILLWDLIMGFEKNISKNSFCFKLSCEKSQKIF
jgi:hypothetical protein